MKVFTRLLKYIVPHKVLLIISFVLLVLGIGFDLLAPWFLKQAIDVGIGENNMQTIILFTALLAIGQLLKSVIMFFQSYCQEWMGQNVTFDLRKQLYAHLQRLSFSYYDKAQTGQIMSRMTGDIDAVKNFFGFGMMSLVMGFVTFIGTVVVMLFLQWKVTLISMVTLPLIIIALIQFNKKVGPTWGAIREQMGRLTTTLQENITGIRVVKAFARESKETEKFGNRNDHNFDANMERANLEAKSFPQIQFYGGVIFILMAWIGGVYAIKGEMSIGTLMAFQWYVWGIIWPLNMLGWLVNIAQQAMKAAPRVFEVLDTKVEIESLESGSRSAEGVKGEVTFEGVSFAFPGQKADESGIVRNVLDQIDIHVRPGEAIGILGSTGSGKSSIIQLLPRFYDAKQGRILIDGVDVREFELHSLRRAVGIVPQETFLFSATIRDNIAYSHPDATQEQIEWAAKKAQIHDFILTMPQGYNTRVGERGVGLSGGQRQRVALARAILMNPPILVLDEATASVDTATESAIHEALSEVMKGRTTFIVAQRLSSIQRADRVIVLEDGRIIEQGTPKELYELGGFFRKLYEIQQRDNAISDDISGNAVVVGGEA